MFSSLAVVLTVALSALAYQITSPNNVTGWTADGSNTVSWQRVDTDVTSFAMFLVNQDRSVLPVNNQLLAATVDGTQGSVVLSPPSGGLPVGKAFQVNFCKDQNSPDTILAQSNQFEITAGGSTSGSSSSSSSTSGTTLSTGSSSTVASSPSGLSTIVVPPSSQTSSALNPSSSGNSSSNVSGALGLRSFEPTFLGAVVLLGALFA